MPPSDGGIEPALIRPAQAAAPPADADRGSLQPNIGAMLHEVTRLMRRHFERRARQSGLPLTRHQARTLMSIARDEGLSQAAIATLLDIEPIALVRMLDRLHEEGLVERRPHPTDRRIRTLWLTAVGWAVVERVLKINAEVREEACAGINPAARDALMHALRQMRVNLTLSDEGERAAVC
ncbi:MAG TPA: MarR family transcriptional regulator [Stellaceae bacterium]|nr:MarR family transcriptional regulator [Stellaceae bacterium]